MYFYFCFQENFKCENKNEESFILSFRHLLVCIRLPKRTAYIAMTYGCCVRMLNVNTYTQLTIPLQFLHIFRITQT